ncbi:MAG: hypothetical protein ACOC16_04185 [Nanoarchaeota archaeon]
MSIIGFNFSKFDCKRMSEQVKGGIEIKHNISIKSVESTKLNVVGSGKTDILKIKFAFDITYGEQIGKINLEGEVIYSDTKEIVEETKKQWDKEKKLNDTVSQSVFRFIYNKSAVKVLSLADSLNLPSPIPLPKINFSAKKSEK